MHLYLDQIFPPKEQFVYAISINEFTKIGYSCNPNERITGMQTSIPYRILIIAIIPCLDMNKLEKELHIKFNDKRHLGEWFKLDVNDIEYIKKLVPEDFVYSPEKNKCRTFVSKNYKNFHNKRKRKLDSNDESFPF